MLPPLFLPVLALPRATAFAEGLLVPVSPHARRQAAIPFPIRFTAAAWRALIADPGRPLPREPAVLQDRLDRVLLGVREGLTTCHEYFAYHHTFTIAFRPASVAVLASDDEDGNATLTVALPSELAPSPT